MDSSRDQAIADRPDAGPECADGGCSTCVEGLPCNRSQACRLGQTSCATGVSACVESGNADDGTPCGSGQVCSVGQCVACSAGAGCVPTNACHQGTLSCTGGVPVCTDLGTPLDEGAKCGTNLVCHQGACLTCKAGATCDVTGAPCRVGQTSCNTGQAACIESSNANNGKACGTGMVCSSGECKACNSGSPCVPTNPCHTGTLDCSAGTATCTDTSASVQDGTGCGTNLVCLSGACVACTGNQDCTPVGTTCKVGKTSCASGTSVCVQSGNAADGSGCGSKQVCSKGACVSCAGGSPCAPTTAPCHTGSLDCSAGTPVCTDLGVNLGNGTSCGTDLVCSGGSCVACKTGDVCTPSNPCQTGTTDCSTGTSVCTPAGSVKDGTANCGTGQVCRGGACVACTEGTSCTPTTAICHKGTQSCATGVPVCTDTGSNATNGTNCGTNLGCANGTCSCTQGTVCTPSGQPCKVGTTECSTGSSVCNVTGDVPDQPAVTCDAGKTCSGGVCVPKAGCPLDGSAVLECPCTTGGSAKCSTNTARPNKLPLLCSAGMWSVPSSGSPCTSNQNCNWTTGVCADIAPQCSGHAAGFQYCTKSQASLSYADVLNTCGADLVTLQTTTQTCNGVCGPGGSNGSTCLSARCGDGKVESGELCDDGNDNPIDGCEPYSAPSGVACTPSKVLSLTLGGRHACARYNGGYVRCWGNNEAGQLGLGHAEFQGDLKPYQLTNADRSALAGPIDLGGPAIDVKAGYDFTCALLADQTVRCWGLNDQGQLGLGNTTAQKTSTPNTLGAINVGGAAVAISVGDSSTCVILSGGALRCWGYNDSGMLGLGNTSTPSTTTTPNLIPTVNLGSANAAYVAVGADDTCVILTNGTIRCFGDNFFGELGMGTGGDPSSTETPSLYGPVALPSADTAAAITAGTNFACARLSSGLAECWGRNMAGQLGIGTTSNVGDNEPATAGVVQTGGKSTSAIAVGTGHTCAILGGGGGLRCWGDNGKGELGYADKNPRGTTSGTVPGSILAVSFGGTLSANAVFVGNLSTCALLSSGEVRCWGWNNYGQLGLGFVSGTSTDYVGGDSAHTPDVVLATSVQLLPP